MNPVVLSEISAINMNSSFLIGIINRSKRSIHIQMSVHV